MRDNARQPQASVNAVNKSDTLDHIEDALPGVLLFSVDREVKHGEIPNGMCVLKVDSNRPDSLRYTAW